MTDLRSHLVVAAFSLLALGATVALAMQPPPAADMASQGPTLFQQRCAACHSLSMGQNGAGPSLAQVVGRSAGTVARFSYSPALTHSGITWTPAQLDAFLASPQKLVPGTRMPVSVPDAAQRGAIILFLATSEGSAGRK